MQVVGSYVSPYVRKVLACLNLKRLDYEIDPITPFFGGDEFERLSPLRKIPILIDGDLTLTDSSVICEYLEEAYAGHALLPAAPADRARARWLEEFADTRLGDVFIWGLFYQRYVHRMVWNEPGDEERAERMIAVEIPTALDYLEERLPADGYLFGDIGIADIAIAAPFPNAFHVGFSIDRARWPRVATFVDRTLGHEAMAALRPFENVQLSTDIPRRRQALLDAGAPLTDDTLGTREPRRGVMRL